MQHLVPKSCSLFCPRFPSAEGSILHFFSPIINPHMNQWKRVAIIRWVILTHPEWQSEICMTLFLHVLISHDAFLPLRDIHILDLNCVLLFFFFFCRNILCLVTSSRPLPKSWGLAKEMIWDYKWLTSRRSKGKWGQHVIFLTSVENTEIKCGHAVLLYRVLVFNKNLN